MKLSKNLSLAEVTRSNTARAKGLDNTPTNKEIANFILLAENIFQPIRDHFKAAIIISSGYRGKALNKAIGGSTNSQHCKGEAIDINQGKRKVTNKMVFEYIKSDLPFDQLIYEFGNGVEPDWVHVSYSSSKKQRGQILRAVKVNGKTEYQNY
jgi:zinc D-Ala-D-Ala carboxypeptidase